MDLSYNPLAHTVTDSNGNYSFDPFPAGTGYRIFASAAGYTLGEQLPFNLTEDSTVTQNFTLQADPNANLTFIAGDVYDSSNNAISGAVVELFLIQVQEGQQISTLQAVTFTNDFGQYVFRDLAQGNYIVTIAKIGYVSVNSSVTIDNLNPNKLVTILSVNPILAKGTISGIITDNADNPVVGADVILYRVETNKTLTPLAATRTIDGGVYLFTNIDQGDYKIKSTEGYIVNQ